MEKSLFKKVFYVLERKQIIIVIGLGFLILISAVFEVFSIGLILPFMKLVGDPQSAFEYEPLKWIYEKFGFNSPHDLVLLLGILMFAAYFIKSGYFLMIYYMQYRFTFNNQVSVAHRLYKSFIKSPYSFHLKNNSAQLLRNLTTEIRGLFEGIIYPSLTIVTESTILIFIVGFLFYMEPLVSLMAIAILGSASIVFHLFVRKRLSRIGKEFQYRNGMMFQSINQGLGGIKEIKVLGREDYFLNDHTNHSQKYAGASRIYGTISQLPRLFIETLVIGGLLIIIIINISKGGDVTPLVPILSVFAMAALRLMPSLNRILSAISTLKFNVPAVNVIYKDIKRFNEEMVDNRATSKSVKIIASKNDTKPLVKLVNVSFTYPNCEGEPVLNNISLEIYKGDSVGIVGPSGSGKTTLVDLILGLLNPDSGYLCFSAVVNDVKTWRKSIGYVPQTIYLCDDTLCNNIAFGLDAREIDRDRVYEVVKLANLEDVVDVLPEGIDTFVGERGIRLSGGERQRVGIARALYHDPSLIVLDEATSSLDYDNEEIISMAIDALAGKKTLIIIAHRLATVKKCKILYNMAKGRIVNSGSFDEVIKNKTYVLGELNYGQRILPT